jgi:hypothetical protein
MTVDLTNAIICLEPTLLVGVYGVLTEVHSLTVQTVVGFALVRIMRGSKGLFAV